MYDAQFKALMVCCGNAIILMNVSAENIGPNLWCRSCVLARLKSNSAERYTLI
jgi:hypothetical protein